MGLTTLGRVQLGRETTAGSAVAATAKLMGVYSATWHEERVIDQPEELRASLARYFRGDTLGKMATIDIEATCTYEDLPFFLSMGVKAGTAGVTDAGSTPAYLWTYNPTLTAQDSPTTFTIEVGDDTQALEAEFCAVRTLEISFAIQERTRVRAGVFGRQLTTTTFTGALGDRTTEDALGQKWVVYVDDTGGTMGATQFAGCIISGTWRLPENFVPHNCLDGTIYFNRIQQSRLAPELDILVEVDSNAYNVRTDWAADRRQLIRLKNTGAVIHGGTPTATASKFIQIDGAYRILDWGPVGGADQDGTQTVRITARGEYDATYGKLFEVLVNNAVASLP